MLSASLTFIVTRRIKYSTPFSVCTAVGPIAAIACGLASIGCRNTGTPYARGMIGTASRAYVDALCGRREQGEAALQQLLAASKTQYVAAPYVAEIYVALVTTTARSPGWSRASKIDRAPSRHCALTLGSIQFGIHHGSELSYGASGNNLCRLALSGDTVKATVQP